MNFEDWYNEKALEIWRNAEPDVEFPKGGVRHVIPYKGNYEDLR